MTQVQAAKRLGVSQPYLSQLERGDRQLTESLTRAAASLYQLPATALPIPEQLVPSDHLDSDKLARKLAGLGYPGFAHLRGTKANPAQVVLEALSQKDLEVRLSEALPWVVLRYPDLDWAWLMNHAKLLDVQNRLGFVVDTAAALAVGPALDRLSSVAQQLERSRLMRVDTLCRESMPAAERDWLSENRSDFAKRWNLLTGLTPGLLPYAAAA
jgi:transcriptional regulator with XRE-family HTH domain